MTEERVIPGIAAAPGIVSGPALRYMPAAVPAQPLGTANQPFAVETELLQLEAALAAADARIASAEQQLQQAGKPDEAAIFTAHRLLLADAELRDRTVALIVESHICAADAIIMAGEEQALQLQALDDPYFRARAADVRDVVGQVRQALLGTATLGESFTRPAIIVATDLGPSDLISVPRERLLGFVLAEGGATAHATILARALEIPAVVGVGAAALATITNDTALLLDGSAGRVIVAPSTATLAREQVKATALAARRADLRRQRDLPTITRDGHTIALLANVASIVEAQTAHEWGAQGVGLLRTELLFLDRPTLPDEDEQVALYRAVAAELPGQPIVVRTLDVGGDKSLPAFPLPAEANSFLGWRGIRIGLHQPGVLLPQLRALLRAGANADIRILLPMISTLAELRQVRQLLRQAQDELHAAGLPCVAEPQLGVMIEVPAAALAADSLARESDFFSIGTNDLTQYTMACDRTNQHVAHLYQPLEPAVLRLIAMAADAAHRHGRPVAVCGEIAGDPTLTALLIGLGIDELSCAPLSLPLVRAAIRECNAAAARDLAQAAQAAASADDVRKLLANSAPQSQ